MAVTGITADGHFVFDDKIDDTGRRVVGLRRLEDGTSYVAATQALNITAVTMDGHFVFNNLIDDMGRRVIDTVNKLLEDGTRYIERS